MLQNLKHNLVLHPSKQDPDSKKYFFYLAHCVPLLGKALPQILPRFSVLGHIERAHLGTHLEKIIVI